MNKKKEISSYVYLALYGIIFIGVGKFVFHSITYLWVQIITYCILGIGGAILFHESYREAFCMWKEKAAKCLLWLAGTYVVDLLLMNLLAIPGYLHNPEYTSQNDVSISVVFEEIPFVLFLLALGVFGPMVEEHVFRVLMVRKQEEHMAVAVSILISAICFMMLHVKAFTVDEMLAHFPKLGTGLVYGFTAYKSKNITIPMILHVMGNSMAIVLMYIVT